MDKYTRQWWFKMAPSGCGIRASGVNYSCVPRTYGRGHVRVVAFSPDGQNCLRVEAHDDTVRIWDVEYPTTHLRVTQSPERTSGATLFPQCTEFHPSQVADTRRRLVVYTIQVLGQVLATSSSAEIEDSGKSLSRQVLGKEFLCLSADAWIPSCYLEV